MPTPCANFALPLSNVQCTWGTPSGTLLWTGASSTVPLPWGATPAPSFQTFNYEPVVAPPLLPNPYGTGLPQVVWDMSQPLSTALYFASGKTPVSVYQLSNTLAVPGVAALSMSIPKGPIMKSLWGHIKIISDKVSGALSCFDVLKGVQAYMHEPITAHELALIQSRYPSFAGVMTAASWPPNGMSIWGSGGKAVRRVDLLCGNTVFGGIEVRVGADGCHYAALHVKNNKIRR